MTSAIRRLLAIAFLTILFISSRAQPDSNLPAKKESKPYKLLTSGKQVTIKSTKDIKHVMLWTTGGNRVIEQKEINTGSYTFTIPISQKAFFLMIGLSDGKIYTEKIGVR